MCKTKRLISALLAGCIIAAVGCSNGNDRNNTSASVTDETSADSGSLTYPVTVKVGYSTGDDDPRGVALAEFKKTVEENTDGDVLIEIHPSAELGNDSELIAGLISGSVDMTVSSAGNYASYDDKIGVSALPFLFSDFESAWSFVDSDIMKSIEPNLEQFNIHVLTYFDNGFRCVTTTEKYGPINSVSDMEGLVIRTPDNRIVMATMSALGANPQILGFDKLIDALKEGTFDAQENPIPVIYNNKLYEVQKYLSITNHSYDAMPLAIRSDLWNSLSAEYREIIETAAKDAAANNRRLVKKQTEDFVSLLEEEGMVVNYPDLTSFKEATSGVMDVFADTYGEDLITSVREFVG